MANLSVCENTALVLKGHNTSAVTKKDMQPFIHAPFIRETVLMLRISHFI